MPDLDYLDNIIYREYVVEYAYRNNVFEENEYSTVVYGVRVHFNGRLGIASSTIVNDFSKLKSMAIANARRCRESVRWFGEDYYDGRVRFGKDHGPEVLREIISKIVSILREKGLKAEVIGVYHKYVKEINVVTQEASAREERVIYELYIYPYIVYMGRLASTGSFIASANPKDLEEQVNNIVEECISNIVAQLNARRLNPAYLGRWPVVLTGSAAPALYHEIAHMLQGDEPLKLKIGMVLGKEITIMEDPFYPGPLQRFFDDELYPAWRRKLIDKGLVVDYLHTRTTSPLTGSRPGNARGLFTRAKPLHHQLIVYKGDWSFNEMLEEMKRCIVIRNLVEARLSGDYVRFIPEEAWVYEKRKDTLTPVKINEVAVPVTKIGESIVGLGKSLKERYSYEKGQLLYEVAPETLIEARVL